MPLTKPASWAWTAGGTSAAAQALLANCVLLVPMWEGSGNPVDLISGLPLVKDAGVTWATRSGMACLDFDGQGSGIAIPAPLLNTSDPVFSIAAVYRLETSGFLEPQYHALYGEMADDAGPQPGTYRSLYAATDVPGYSGLYLDRYRLVDGANIDENSGRYLNDVVKDGAFHAAVGASTGQFTAPRMYQDAADVFSAPDWMLQNAGTPPDGQTTVARIGTFANPTYWTPPEYYSLLGSLAFVAGWTRALTAGECTTLSTTPFDLITEEVAVGLPAYVTLRRRRAGRRHMAALFA